MNEKTAIDKNDAEPQISFFSHHLCLCDDHFLVLNTKPGSAFFLFDPAAQIFYLLRFVCFMAVVYLALHKIVARLSRKPGSKLLWFFSVVTAPLTRPVRKWLAPGTTEKRVVSAALIFYTLLWLLIIIVARLWTTALA